MDNTKCTTVKTDKKEDHKLIHTSLKSGFQ